MSSTKPTGAADPSEIAARYQVIQKLGAGAFGTVYKAKDRILGRMVAIKTIRLEGLAAQGASLEELTERFKREAQVSAQLKHPNIVTIYDVGDADGMSYLAMEFIDGVGLDRVITGAGRLPVERAASIAAQIADALDFAHKNGVVHRDIKPANIMIEAGDRVKVTDFGIAKVVTSGEHLTMTGSLLGTPSYMSPEQARGTQIDGRSDLFAVGCILYEMVTGQKAFRGDSITGLIFKIITEEPHPVRALDPDVSEELVQVIARALSKAPETRYQSGRELADALGSFARPGSTPTLRQAEMPTAATPLPGVSGTPTVAAATPTRVGAPAPTQVSPPPRKPTTSPPPPPRVAPRPPAPPPEARPGARRSGGGAGLLIGLGFVGLLFVGAAAAGVWYAFLRRPPTDPAVALSGDAGSSATATSEAGAPSPTVEPPAAPLAQEPPAGSEVASMDVPAGSTTTAPAATGGPSGEVASRSTGDPAPRPQPPATRLPAAEPPAGRGGSAGATDYSFLDEEPEQTPDGTEAGQRLAQGYRRDGGRSGGAFGTGGRFRPRERSPRNLALPERPAVAVLRQVINAQEIFYKKEGRYGSYSELLSARTLFLDVPAQARAFVRKNYRFELALDDDGFTALAIPMNPGLRPFVGDDSGFIRQGTE